MPFTARAASALSVLLLAGAPLAAQDSLPQLPPPPEVTLPAPTQGQPSGRITGQVIDRETGRPVSGVRVAIQGSAAVETDLDGRYRSLPLAVRTYLMRAALIGYRPGQIDSVVVVAGRATTADFALEPITMQVEGITVEAAAVSVPSSEASLLAMQQSAGQVSDGISAEAISRSPDSDAADAVTRVTGISVVDNKFVVVRGLPERYSNTLLNGSELSSPDPSRRVVPLDIFPASLLEAIITTKTATPDRPGDFSGGSVEIRTKEFPEQRVVEFDFTQGWNSISTFASVPLPRRQGWDILGFDDGRRELPPNAPAAGAAGGLRAERFGEGIRNVWTPPSRTIGPATRLGVDVGGQIGQSVPFGVVLSFTYASDAISTPDRVFALYNDPNAAADRSLIYQDARTNVDWGAIANFSLRPSPGSKLSLRNLLTHGAIEGVTTASGYDTENARVIRVHQVQYIQQSFLQSQLAGEHHLRGFLDSRLEWRGTIGRSLRDEPENRQLTYVLQPDGQYAANEIEPSRFFDRTLRDNLLSGQTDWSVPFGLRTRGDGILKLGGLFRRRDRDFDSALYRAFVDEQAPNAHDVARMAPEQLFAPENIGGVLQFEKEVQIVEPYTALDQVSAAYLMLDFFPLRRFRLVGGARYEDWRLVITPKDTMIVPDSQRVGDLLWSANLAVELGHRTNLRFAGFRSVSRPDAREASPDAYVPVVGACSQRGNADLRRTAILNYDARFEFYRRPGEIISVSGFYKSFDAPIVEAVFIPGGGQCQVTYINGNTAYNYGIELEVRRELPIRGVFAGANLTLVQSGVTIDTVYGRYDPDLPLQGQSPWLINGNLAYTTPSGRFNASLLLNYFASRVVRYGTSFGQSGQGPDLYERGRVTLDAKVQLGIGRHLTMSFSGRNITGTAEEFYHPATAGDVVAGYQRRGASVSTGVGYAF